MAFLAPPFSGTKFKDLCKEWLEVKFLQTALAIVAMFSVVIINQILKVLMEFLVKWVRILTEAWCSVLKMEFLVKWVRI
jgi:hypothetical protein